jgi:SAM-dependent methyltransferase
MSGAPAEGSLHHPRYPRSNGYDEDWVRQHQMGPHVLWLTESLLEVLPIAPGDRVLDLGCGTAMSSIFLARECGARVWATDLWIPAADNQRRIEEAGVGDLVTAIHAEAHALPFGAGAFDVIVSVDAYQYFGTADLYLGYLVDFLRPGGRLGAVMPAVLEEVGEHPPEHLRPWWEWDFCCFHGPAWWRTHWAKTGKVVVDHADVVPDGWKDWLRFNDATTDAMAGWRHEAALKTHAMLEADQGRTFAFTRVTATRPAPSPRP